jgi:hypothetical protein
VDAGGEDADAVRDELYDAAFEELTRRAGGRLQMRAVWVEGHASAPWALGDAWIGDEVTLSLPSWFGGSVAARVTEFSVSLEPSGTIDGQTVPGTEWVEYVFDALVEDITEGAESS